MKQKPPALAPKIWMQGDLLFLAFPGPEGQEGHTVAIPLSKCSIEHTDFGQPLTRQRGWVILLDVLRQRERESQRMAIATEAAPVQYDVEKALRAQVLAKVADKKALKAQQEAMKLIKKAGGKSKAIAALKELGLL